MTSFEGPEGSRLAGPHLCEWCRHRDDQGYAERRMLAGAAAAFALPPKP